MDTSIFLMAHRTRHRHHEGDFDQADPSIYMLGLSKSYSMPLNWFIFAILTATVLAIGLVALGNLIF